MAAGATYEPIATSSPTGTTTVTFNSFGGYTDLVIVAVAKNDTTAGQLLMRFNSDSTGPYTRTLLVGDGTSATSSRATTGTSISLTGGTSMVTTADTFIMAKANIFSYTGSTNKTLLVEHSQDLNGSGRTGRYVFLWPSTSAITSIELFTNGGNFSSGTRFTLYGIKAA